MGNYSKRKNITKKKCRESNICHKCGGELELIEIKNGKYLCGTRCKLCLTPFYGKVAIPNNPINPYFNSKKITNNKKMRKLKKFEKKMLREWIIT